MVASSILKPKRSQLALTRASDVDLGRIALPLLERPPQQHLRLAHAELRRGRGDDRVLRAVGLRGLHVQFASGINEE